MESDVQARSLDGTNNACVLISGIVWIEKTSRDGSLGDSTNVTGSAQRHSRSKATIAGRRGGDH
jgi:hypothetical protein